MKYSYEFCGVNVTFESDNLPYSMPWWLEMRNASEKNSELSEFPEYNHPEEDDCEKYGGKPVLGNYPISAFPSIKEIMAEAAERNASKPKARKDGEYVWERNNWVFKKYPVVSSNVRSFVFEENSKKRPKNNMRGESRGWIGPESVKVPITLRVKGRDIDFPSPINAIYALWCLKAEDAEELAYIRPEEVSRKFNKIPFNRKVRAFREQDLVELSEDVSDVIEKIFNEEHFDLLVKLLNTDVELCWENQYNKLLGKVRYRKHLTFYAYDEDFIKTEISPMKAEKLEADGETVYRTIRNESVGENLWGKCLTEYREKIRADYEFLLVDGEYREIADLEGCYEQLREAAEATGSDEIAAMADEAYYSKIIEENVEEDKYEGWQEAFNNFL